MKGLVQLEATLKQWEHVMAIPQVFERRIHRRKKLTGLLPGRLSAGKGADVIRCKPVDISETGLGILTDAKLEVGTPLILSTEEHIIHLKVIWKNPDFSKSDLYRFGLELTDSSTKYNLEEIFEKAGCLV
jgi:hypothetical protein